MDGNSGGNMKVMVGVAHPKHVHVFKNFIRILIQKGHEVKIVARSKDITKQLLDSYNFEYEVVGTHRKGLIKKAYGLVESDFKILKVAQKFKPDILVAGSPYLGQVSKLIGKPHIGFTDTENARFNNLVSFAFSDIICTPSCYKGKVNSKKHIKYNGYEELCYLHPNYFKPDKSIFDSIQLNENSRFIIVRFVAWEASHDIGDKGFTDKTQIVKYLEQYAQVLITSEKNLPKEFEKYKINISPHRIHDLMYYADLFIGESPSMACESALLGTPSIFVSTTRRGYTDELETKYDMVYNFSDPVSGQTQALNKAVELLSNENTKEDWKKKKDKLLKEKIDVTRFLVELVEKYPGSFHELKSKEQHNN